MIRRITHPLSILIAISLVLASCTIGAKEQDPAAAALLANSPAAQLATIQLTAQADTSVPLNTVGQSVNIALTFQNTGTAGVAGAVLVTGATATCPALTTIGNLNDSLDQGETGNCTATYAITQADLDKGSAALTITITINGINSNPVTVNVPLVQPRAISLTTTANPTTYDQAGRQIVFTYVIKNTGSLSLGPAAFTVNDSLVSTTPINCGDANATIAPGASISCNATYTISQADAGAVSITSNATASGGGAPNSAPFPLTVNKGAVSSQSTTSTNLTPGATTPHTVVEGEWIWQIGRCYGVDPKKIIEANPQLKDPAQISPGMILSIPNVGSKGTAYGPPCVVPYVVKTGDTWSSIAQLYNADVTILQMANKNSMSVGTELNVPRNSAGGASAPSSGGTTKALSLSITASPTTYEQVGQQINYTYVIKNSGNTTLGPDQFKVSDSLIGTSPFNCGSANTTLAPNATVTCSASHPVTDADMNAVSITNIATATGGGAPASQNATFTVNKGSKSISLTISPNTSTYEQAGQQIIYTYTIKNTGGSTLGPAQFSVTDTLISPSPFLCGDANATIAPNATVTCTATYVITQNDLGAVAVTNIATATGAGLGPTQPPSSANVTKAAKALTLTTTANPATYNQAGQKITFTYLIKNSGNTTIGPVQFTVTDTLVSTTPINCGGASTTLTPEATVSCTADYTITQADAGAVSITDIATATGGGVSTTQTSSVTVNKQ